MHAAALLTCLALAFAAVPLNTPFQVVQPMSNHTSLTIVPDGLTALAQHRGNIALVSVVGPYHSGKSFLLNALLGHTQVFSVGKQTSPETMGIWICRTNLVASDGSEVWLMDSEGFFGPGVQETYDAKVFTIAALAGAHLVYNTVKVIDQQAVGLLEMLIQRAQLFRTRSAATAAEGVPEFLLAENMPALTWVVEDFVQELPERLRDEGATGWLRTYLEASGVGDASVGGDGDQVATSGGSGRRSDFLSKVYRDIRVHTLFLPATSREQLRDLSRLGWDELTSEFRTEVDDLRRHILRSLQARRNGGRAMTGQSLASVLQFIVHGLQQGMFQELPSLWGTWTSQVATVSLDDADAWFASLLQKVDKGEDPVSLRTFNERLEEARESATTFYRSLLRNFEIAPQMGEVRRRMEAHVERVLPAYHERVRRWVGSRLAGAKERVGVLLASRELPMDPAALEREGQAAIEAARKNFSSELNTFAAVQRSSHFAQAAKMPDFAPDPATQLASDLNAQLGMRILENERSVQQLFKLAVTAADETIARELKAPGPALLSKARLKEIRKAVEQRYWQVFEDRLAGYSWSKSVSHYRASRALLQVDHYEARMAAFMAANEQRLKTHFFAALDRAIAGYNANRSSVILPAAEADVEAEHTRLAVWTRELLADSAQELTDTDTFSDARARLDLALVEGFQQVREKNIELWKAHSDEATRCALAANRVVERECGSACLFNTIPWAHQATCRRHLSDCFARSAIGVHMAPTLRAQVFKAWYAKDLIREAQRVQFRFTVLLATLLALAGGVWWSCRSKGPQRAPTMWPPIYGQQQQQQQPNLLMPQSGCFGQPQRSECFTSGHQATSFMQPRPGYQPASGFSFFRAGA